MVVRGGERWNRANFRVVIVISFFDRCRAMIISRVRSFDWNFLRCNARLIKSSFPSLENEIDDG